MGMSAHVLAIGRFRRALVPILPRPAICYDNVREGTEIIEQLCADAPGSTASRDLAEALGVRPWDFDTHAFDPHRVDVRALES